MAEPPSPTLLLGLGNTLMGDDAVGCLAAREVHRVLPPGTADLLDGPLVGLDLAAWMEGYERVVLIDALVDPGAPVGAVRRIALEETRAEGRPSSAHALGLADSLALLRRLGAELPPRIAVYGIVARHTDRIQEGLTAELQASLPTVVAEILTRSFAGIRITGR